jgi:hypothetical protein
MEGFKPAYWPTQGWKNALPEQQGMDSAQLVGMFEYIDSHDIPLASQVLSSINSRVDD